MKNFLFSILTLFAVTAFGASTANKTISFVDGIQSRRDYILNGNFENQGIKGWATYKNTAQATPVNGTGGSPTHVTISRTTSSPLRGVGSLAIANSGSTSAQGEGVSYDFAIDTADQGAAMQVSFNYAVASGTFVPGTSSVTGDLNVYLYDVTNSIVIQPIGYQLTGSVSGQQYAATATFQAPSNSTSLRLIFQVASTNTSAWTLNVDAVQVGPWINSSAPLVTPWVSFTPTGTWTANSTYTGQWRRVGDSIEIQYDISLAGAPTSTPLIVNPPTGIAFDTSKIPGFDAAAGLPLMGIGVAKHSGTTYNLQLFYQTNAMGVVYQSAITGAQSAITQAAPVTWASGDHVTLTTIRIPVLGWQTNVQISSDVGSQLVSTQYNGQPTGTLAGTFNAATYPTKVVDTTNSYSGSTYTVPTPGNYDVSAQLAISATYTAANRAGIAIYINGVQKYTQLIYAGSVSTTEAIPQISVKSVPLNAGDTLVIRSFCEGASPSYDSSVDRSYFSIARVSNPSPILQVGVQSSSQGQQILNWANVTPTSSGACTINSQSGTWIASVTAVAQGRCTLNFTTGTFSGAPVCTGGDSAPGVLTNNYSVNFGSTSSTSAQLFSTLQTSGSNTVSGNADPVNIQCVGPR